MRSTDSPARGWQRYLPAYGKTPLTDDPVDPPRRDVRRRSGVLGWLMALVIGAALAMLALHTLQDPRSVGTQLDDAVASVRAAGSQAGQTLADSQNAVADASSDAVAGVGTAFSDTGISLKVKTALAADPALSASRIDVDTVNGIVRLQGPAPDANAKARATVLAGAPQGVRGVDNQLALPQGSRVVPVPNPVQAALPASATAPAASQDGVKSVDNRPPTSEATTLLARSPQ